MWHHRYFGSFNEAVAFQPRKYGSSVPARYFLIGFNEAVAFQPRKSLQAQEPTSWSCSFNEAVAFQPRKSRPAARSVPQTSGFNEAVAFQPRKSGNDYGVFPMDDASMRPWHFSHGNVEVTPSGTARAHHASMRPWHFSHGNPELNTILRTKVAVNYILEQLLYEIRICAKARSLACNMVFIGTSSGASCVIRHLAARHFTPPLRCPP